MQVGEAADGQVWAVNKYNNMMKEMILLKKEIMEFVDETKLIR